LWRFLLSIGEKNVASKTYLTIAAELIKYYNKCSLIEWQQTPVASIFNFNTEKLTVAVS